MDNQRWRCALKSVWRDGQILTALENLFEGKTAKEVRQTLAAHVGVSRFRQRLFTEDGYREIPDDEVFGPAPVQVQLVMLEFLPPDAEEDERVISACQRNDSASVERFLQGPRNPNLQGGHGWTWVKTVCMGFSKMWIPQKVDGL